jgi:type IV pilus assembly protein PilP
MKAGTSVNARILSLLAGALLTAATAHAQAPATTAAPASAPAPGAAAPAEESPAYTYDPQGRRDPFISLLRRGVDADRTRVAPRLAGLSGFEVAEVVLKGTMQSPTGYVALVEAADKKTYIVKAGDKLVDGTIRSITADTVVILQDVNDPLSLEKHREVRKMLRQTEEVK